MIRKSMGKRVNTIRFWEEINANIWPSFESFLYDGWLLRITPGYSRNSNSVWPLYDGEIGIETKVGFCAEFYSSRGMTCGFRLADIPENGMVEKKLIELGYASANPNLVMVNALIAESSNPTIEMGLDEWLEIIYEIHPGDPQIKEWERKLFQKITLPSRYVIIEQNEKVAGYGRTVKQGQILNIEKIWVHPEVRNQGLGTQLIQGMIDRGVHDGGKTAYVTVNRANTGARRLYARLGFEAKYEYRYFVPQSEAE